MKKNKSYTERLQEEQERINEFNAKSYLKILLIKLLWIILITIVILFWLVFVVDLYYDHRFNSVFLSVAVISSVLFCVFLIIHIRRKKS